ncbi:ubiquinone/menaquinone biosynthesis C-methylase UbiE [Haloactinopolyspora alba]|uniref:Ubiquinone/menaquinone biosynthesis C-methylase UbiE n=1 Tax=Haloactinopolyspora alba TaxID=648780 RepID=A0A2P8E3K3_9ACTN|nr:methyltransferase domain-containing protein [Haloactinopolyspora alba]PSL04007.1 ubiquinone/menaquinone biosynthesis C-methylase UbiE [Haloactinopolyspora alba]
MSDTTTTAETRTGTGWQLRDDAAAAYEEYLVPVIFEPFARRLVDHAAVLPGARVLDVGCGTGAVARAAARRLGHTGTVTGIDINPDMLATARRVTADADAAVEFHQADVTDLPFDDATFDAVLCQQAVQFFDDRVAALGEMRRVTAPGGRVTFSVLRSLAHHPVYDTFARALGRHAGQSAAAMMASPFALGAPETLRADAHAAGFAEVSILIAIGEERFPTVPEFVRREAAGSPLAAPLSALTTERQAALVADLEHELSEYLDDAGLAFGNETHLVSCAS